MTTDKFKTVVQVNKNIKQKAWGFHAQSSLQSINDSASHGSIKVLNIVLWQLLTILHFSPPFYLTVNNLGKHTDQYKKKKKKTNF